MVQQQSRRSSADTDTRPRTEIARARMYAVIAVYCVGSGVWCSLGVSSDVDLREPNLTRGTAYINHNSYPRPSVPKCKQKTRHPLLIPHIKTHTPRPEKTRSNLLQHISIEERGSRHEPGQGGSSSSLVPAIRVRKNRGAGAGGRAHGLAHSYIYKYSHSILFSKAAAAAF